MKVVIKVFLPGIYCPCKRQDPVFTQLYLIALILSEGANLSAMTFSGFFSKILLLLGFFAPSVAFPQQFDLFEIRNDELYWHNTYKYSGSSDSLRREVVTMLKSKHFTFNVIRNETGYNGELRHYQVEARKYGRRYFSTPRMYWNGEWTGKFIVEVFDQYYRVTVYALYAEKVEKTGYYRTERTMQGRYLDVVAKKDHGDFKPSERHNLVLMSLSLKDNFDIRNAVSPIENSQVRY
jgi:hypothetical protein